MDKIVGLLPLVTLLIITIVLIRFNKRKRTDRNTANDTDTHWAASSGADRSGGSDGD